MPLHFYQTVHKDSQETVVLCEWRAVQVKSVREHGFANVTLDNYMVIVVVSPLLTYDAIPNPLRDAWIIGHFVMQCFVRWEHPDVLS